MRRLPRARWLVAALVSLAVACSLWPASAAGIVNADAELPTALGFDVRARRIAT